ncbi:hypothetical protein [Yersinia rohdei]|uniref:hypothetical protein n=1 Tax=Yersinia rohdei TaxID=29485 RepID=UPI0011A31FB1|nr:hypothetical protein [Yersinia rohdei]
MQFSELTILYFQMLASIFMGWDYFMPILWRKKINIRLGEYFLGVQSNVDRDISRVWKRAVSSIKRVIISVIMLLCAFGIMRFSIVYGKGFPIAVDILLMTIYLLLIAAPSIFLVELLLSVIVSFGVGGVFFRSTATFLTKTEKGPIAGVGFIFLLVSFVMRYVNYSV